MSKNITSTEGDMEKQLRDAYAESCKQNDTTEDDLAYFQSYVFHLVALMVKRIQDLENGKHH